MLKVWRSSIGLWIGTDNSVCLFLSFAHILASCSGLFLNLALLSSPADNPLDRCSLSFDLSGAWKVFGKKTGGYGNVPWARIHNSHFEHPDCCRPVTVVELTDKVEGSLLPSASVKDQLNFCLLHGGLRLLTSMVRGLLWLVDSAPSSDRHINTLLGVFRDAGIKLDVRRGKGVDKSLQLLE